MGRGFVFTLLSRHFIVFLGSHYWDAEMLYFRYSEL
jgi:hypothetical protein